MARSLVYGAASGQMAAMFSRALSLMSDASIVSDSEITKPLRDSAAIVGLSLAAYVLRSRM